MNHVKLNKFDAETLSLVNYAIDAEIKALRQTLSFKNADWKFREPYEGKISRLLVFQTQVLYAYHFAQK